MPHIAKECGSNSSIKGQLWQEVEGQRTANTVFVCFTSQLRERIQPQDKQIRYVKKWRSNHSYVVSAEPDGNWTAAYWQGRDCCSYLWLGNSGK